jgi:hypothetical protein
MAKRRTSRMVWWLLPPVIAACVLAYVLHQRIVVVPDRLKPWTPLELDEPPNFLTHLKLVRLRDNPALCQSVLAQAEMRYEPAPDRVTGPGCGFKNAVIIHNTTASIGKAFSLSCQAAVSLALWERHVLQPIALEEFGLPVERIEHYGTYSCRNMNHRVKGRRSLHASADAIDIAGFVLADGYRIRIQKNWPELDREAIFLRRVHEGACPIFSAVLGPDYNQAHRDHFHFDVGPYRVCR